MVSVARADDFEHGTSPQATYPLFLHYSGSPEVGAGYAKNGSYGVRVGRGGDNDDWFQMPSEDTDDFQPQGCVEFWWKPVSHDTDNEYVGIIGFDMEPGGGIYVADLYRKAAGPTYVLRHVTVEVLTLTLGNWYRIRHYFELDGSDQHVWLWVWDAGGTPLVTADYRLRTPDTSTKAAYRVGTINANLNKVNVDCYMDTIGYADEYFTTIPTLTLFHPDADDGTEDDWTQSAGPDKYAMIDETVPAVGDYISSWTDDHKQLCGTDASLSGSPDHISIGVGAGCILIPFSQPGVEFFIRTKDGVTVTEESLDTPPAGSWKYGAFWLDAAPSGGAWTNAKVNAFLVGCRLTTVAGGSYCVWAMGYAVEATADTPPTPPVPTGGPRRHRGQVAG